MPGAANLKVRLIFEVGSGVILGGQITGATSGGELINKGGKGKMMKGRRESNFAYKLMVLTYKMQDLLFKPDNILDEFGIEKGFTVVDFGCGPGRYIKQASMLVGETGKVFAIDINEIAIKHVEKCIAKFNLHNVIPVLYKDNCSEIASESVDVVYALDMFHQVDNPKEFLGVCPKTPF